MAERRTAACSPTDSLWTNRAARCPSRWATASSRRTSSRRPGPTSCACGPRRSAQTAMWHIAEAMVRWLALILSFTAEEIWGELPGARMESVFLSTWHALPAAGGGAGAAIDWAALIALRTDVSRELERLRVAGEIGAPLEAELDVYCLEAQYPRLNAFGDELRFLMITSQARVQRVSAAPAGGLAVALGPGGGVWIYVGRKGEGNSGPSV